METEIETVTRNIRGVELRMQSRHLFFKYSIAIFYKIILVMLQKIFSKLSF